MLLLLILLWAIFIQFPSKKRYPYISIFKSFELTSFSTCLGMEFLKGFEDIKFQLRFKLQKFYLTTLTMMHCCWLLQMQPKFKIAAIISAFMKNDEISTIKKVKCQEMLLLLRVLLWLLLLCWWMKKKLNKPFSADKAVRQLIF